nr:MAG TPA: hypothetical protein [Caudoviricetes sp.]
MQTCGKGHGITSALIISENFRKINIFFKKLLTLEI